uniref:helix-turn-helix domain-containing protein n=1 Tax=Saccharomonospora marina TaxID=632569 RepID=UPI000303AE14
MHRMLTLADREEISRGLAESLEYKEIAVRIGRSCRVRWPVTVVESGSDPHYLAAVAA